MSEYTINDIKSAYSQKKEWEKQFPINYFFVRPLSFFLTYFVLLITKNPAKVAFVGFIFGAFALFSFIGSSIWSIWPGIIFLSLYSLSDAIDGNIARTTDNVTLYGIYLDGLIGIVIEGFYFFSIALGLTYDDKTIISSHIFGYRSNFIVSLPLFLGSLILISKLWSSIFHNLYDIFKIKIGEDTIQSGYDVKGIIGKSTYSDRWYYQLFINLDSLNNQLLILILCSLLKIELFFLTFFALFYFFKALIYLAFYFHKTKSMLL